VLELFPLSFARKQEGTYLVQTWKNSQTNILFLLDKSI